VKIKWISSEINPSDLFTKNLNNKSFKRHSTVFVRNDDVVKCKFREGVSSGAYGCPMSFSNGQRTDTPDVQMLKDISAN
jgi:hypothetical protein